MALEPEERVLLERIARSLEGIEMLIAMWLERSSPAGEFWVVEGPDRTLLKKPWRIEE